MKFEIFLNSVNLFFFLDKEVIHNERIKVKTFALKQLGFDSFIGQSLTLCLLSLLAVWTDTQMLTSLSVFSHLFHISNAMVISLMWGSWRSGSGCVYLEGARPWVPSSVPRAQGW